MKTGQDSTCFEVDVDFLCMLSWQGVDGIWLQGWPDFTDPALDLCDSTGMFAVLDPVKLVALGLMACGASWSRDPGHALGSDSAFVNVSTDASGMDSIMDAGEMRTHLEAQCGYTAYYNADRACLWYYDTWNEGPAWQRSRMVDDSSPYDDLVPGMYTQDTSMVEVDPQGVFSWMKHVSDSLDAEHAVSCTFSTMHRIRQWADYYSYPFDTAPTFHTQANSVRAFIGMEYEDLDTLMDNPPAFLGCNAYPFRLVGTVWEDGNDGSVLGDSLGLWMLDHYEEGLDSTIVLAATLDHFPVHYHPQAFGMCGGSSMWWIDTFPEPDDTLITYASYKYRIPSPAEFRMLCNVALLRQAKGVFPFSIRSYDEGSGYQMAGLLDEELVPFDAPYEEWVYRDRARSDWLCAPPDSFPPFRGGFDPLFDLDSRPSTSGERQLEDYLEWKFEPYGRLWRSLRGTLDRISAVAPELSGLWWWEGHEDDASMEYPDSSLPIHWMPPEIRVFTDDAESSAYLFYVNRHCRSARLDYLIEADEDEFPEGTLTGLVLDHSRRFLVPVDEDGGVFSFLDTLDAGSARLVQFVDTPLAADLRITRGDVTASHQGGSEALREYRFTAGDAVEITAVFYNMGTQSSNGIATSLVDLTGGDTLDTAGIDLPGLSTSGYACAVDTAVYSWTTDSDDIGTHVLEISAEPWSGEPDTLDDSARVLFLIVPRDYATEETDDPWDMSETAASPPVWKTDDVAGLSGWTGTYTDSIGGMFEGMVDDGHLGDNRMSLRLDAPLDAGFYDRLGLAVFVEREIELWLGWETDESVEDSVLVDTIAAGWSELERVDLGGDLPDDTLEVLWLGFRPDGGADMRVRVGRVELTE